MAEAERTIVDQYHYTNHLGEVVRIKIRYDDKSFIWSEPLKADEEIPKFYRFGRIVDASGKATEYSPIIYLVEGEKDVKTLEGIDKFATTAYQSGYKFDDEGILSFFKDKDIVILPDNDEKGREYSETAARAFKKSGYPSSVKIVDLAKIFPYEFEEKWDITDFLENWPEEGQSPREIFNVEIENRLNEFPEYELTEEEQDQKDEPEDNYKYPALTACGELLNKEIPQVYFLIEGIMPSSGLVILGGPPKLGKTYLCLYFALSLVSGKECLGQKMPENFGHVLYVDAENGESLLQKRIREYLKDNEVDDEEDLNKIFNKLFFLYEPQRLFDEPSFVDQIKNYRKSNPEIKCIIVDTYNKITSERKSSLTQNQHDGRELQELSKYVHEEDLLCILIHHSRKEPGSEVFNDLLGTISVQASVDHLICFTKRVNAETSATEEYGLHIRGRNCQERHFKAEFYNRNWSIVEDLESQKEFNVSDEFKDSNDYYKAIVEFLTDPKTKPVYKNPDIKSGKTTAHGLRKYLAIAGNTNIEFTDKPALISRNIQKIKDQLETLGGIHTEIKKSGKNTISFEFSTNLALSWDDYICAD